MVGHYQSSHRSGRDGTVQGRSYSFLDTAGDAVRDYLRGQARTDLPFKLSNYRPDGEGTKPLLSRILTDYDVPVSLLKAFARAFGAFPDWSRRAISPVFWTHVVVSLDSIWVKPEPAAPTALGEIDTRGPFERFLCKAEEKLNDDTRSEVVDGIESIELVDCDSLSSYRVDSQHFQSQILRFTRILDSLQALRVFRWSSELPMSLSILRALAHKPQLTRCYIRIDADAFRRHSFPKDIRATIPLEGGGETLTPFCTAFEGAPDVPSDTPVRKIAARVKIVLEEASEEDCAAVPEWVDLVFVSLTTLTVHAPVSSEAQPRPVQVSEKQSRPNRALEVQDLILVRLPGSAARHLTSRVRLEGFHGLALEWCIEYGQTLAPLAHLPCGLRRLEVYSPSAAWYQANQARELQKAEDILLCDFIRSGTFELQRLHIIGGAFSIEPSLHNFLFFAMQTHLKSLRQLRVIASDQFGREELRELGHSAPKLADLLIHAPADNILPTLSTDLRTFPSLRTFTLHHAMADRTAKLDDRRRRRFLAATTDAAAKTPLKKVVYREGTGSAGSSWSYRIERPRRKGRGIPPKSVLVGAEGWTLPDVGFVRSDVL